MQRSDSYACDAPPLQALDSEAVAVDIDGFTDVGHVAERVEDQSTNRIPVVRRQIRVEQLVEIAHRQPAVHAHRAIGECLVQWLFAVELVANIAYQFFEQVFDGDEPGGSTVFVDDNREMELSRLHQLEQLVGLFGLGYELRRAHDGAHQLVAAAGPLGAHHVFRVRDADDVVDVVADHGQARESATDGYVHRFGDRGIAIDGDHVGTRDHHFACD